MSNLPLLWCLHACMQINFLLNTTNLLKHYWLREKFWILKQHLLWDGGNTRTPTRGKLDLQPMPKTALGDDGRARLYDHCRASALEDTCKIKWRKIPPKRDTSVESRSRTLVGRMPTTSICHLLHRRFSAIAYIFYVINPLFFFNSGFQRYIEFFFC